MPYEHCLHGIFIHQFTHKPDAALHFLFLGQGACLVLVSVVAALAIDVPLHRNDAGGFWVLKAVLCVCTIKMCTPWIYVWRPLSPRLAHGSLGLRRGDSLPCNTDLLD